MKAGGFSEYGSGLIVVCIRFEVRLPFCGNENLPLTVFHSTVSVTESQDVSQPPFLSTIIASTR